MAARCHAVRKPYAHTLTPNLALRPHAATQAHSQSFNVAFTTDANSGLYQPHPAEYEVPSGGYTVIIDAMSALGLVSSSGTARTSAPGVADATVVGSGRRPNPSPGGPGVRLSLRRPPCVLARS